MNQRTFSAGIKRIGVVVQGRVQGVGFRYFTRDRARRHGLTGWVRNLPDGEVEFEAQGAGENVDAFVTDIRKGPALSYVSDVKIFELPLEEGEDEFEVTY